MGFDRGSVSAAEIDGTTASGSAGDCGRNYLDPADGLALARFARGVRPVGHGLGLVRHMECRWNSRQNPAPIAVRGGGRRRHRRRVVVCRWNQRSGGAVCRRRWKKNDPDEPDDHAIGRSRGGQCDVAVTVHTPESLEYKWFPQ